ncbi:MAG: SufD family Fe-S cluster assembly protein, partial [Bacilli bacterium]
DKDIVFKNNTQEVGLSVYNLDFEILKNTNLNISYDNIEETKLAITFKIKKNVKFKITELRKGLKSKVQYKFYLEQNSQIDIDKFYNLSGSKELVVIYLNGKDASINYNFKTICHDKEKYDLMVYHNAPQTISNIINKGVNNGKGNLIFNVSSFVPSGNVACCLNQMGQIINLTDGLCQINPNLLIDEFDVKANHSANIGKFSEEAMFYLQSRGISHSQALNLLIKGFLLEGVTNNKTIIKKIINDYWG